MDEGGNGQLNKEAILQGSLGCWIEPGSRRVLVCCGRFAFAELSRLQECGDAVLGP